MWKSLTAQLRTFILGFALLALAACGGSTGTSSDAGVDGQGGGNTLSGDLAFPVASVLEGAEGTLSDGGADYAKMFIAISSTPIECASLASNAAPPPPGTHFVTLELSGTSAFPSPGHYAIYPNRESCASDGGACNPAGKSLELAYGQVFPDGGADQVMATSGTLDATAIGPTGFSGSFAAVIPNAGGATSTLAGTIADGQACGYVP